MGRSYQESSQTTVAENRHHFAHDVACMNIRSQQDITFSCDRRLIAFEICYFFITCTVKGDWSIYDTAGDLTALIHFLQFFGIQGLRHLRIHFFLTCKHTDLRAVPSEGTHGINRILNDISLLLQRRIIDHTSVYRNIDLAHCRDLVCGKHTDGTAVFFAKAMFTVDHGFQINAGIQLAFHQDLCFAFMDQVHCFPCSCFIVRLIINIFIRNIQSDLCANLFDLIFMTDQNRFCQSAFYCHFNCAEGVVIICSRHNHAAHLLFSLQLFDYFIETSINHFVLLILLSHIHDMERFFPIHHSCYIFKALDQHSCKCFI